MRPRYRWNRHLRCWQLVDPFGEFARDGHPWFLLPPVPKWGPFCWGGD